jgi:hypothetical protein|tara:strand:- start:3058 stop:3771 length:714 start_codon:yes stop_codon:yes gene_type:complete
MTSNKTPPINKEKLKSKSLKGDKFWFNDGAVLIQRSRLSEFYPSYDMTLVEKLNAISRLSIYLGIVLYLFSMNYLYFYIPVVIIFFTLFIYKTQINNIEMYFNSYKSPLNEHNKNILEEKTCTKPTYNNPFMNINVISDNPQKTEACKSWDNKKLKTDIKEKFNTNLYRDVSDLYGKNNSQRQYYTMPSTTLPNKQTEFAKWCYNTGATCKEDTIKCAPQWEMYKQSSKVGYDALHQ